MKLVKFSDDWADEEQITGWAIWESSTWNEFVETAKVATNYPIDVNLGRERVNEYNNSEQLLKCFQAFDITEEQTEFLNKVFSGYKERGYFPEPYFEIGDNSFVDYLEDDEVEECDEEDDDLDLWDDDDDYYYPSWLFDDEDLLEDGD
jgi:hypothetical protein